MLSVLKSLICSAHISIGGVVSITTTGNYALVTITQKCIVPLICKQTGKNKFNIRESILKIYRHEIGTAGN